MHENVDAEWVRLREMYSQMNDDELLRLCGQQDELTEVAREALGAVLAERGIAGPDGTDGVAAYSGNLPGGVVANRAVIDGRGANGEEAVSDDGWVVLWASTLVVLIRKATAVLEAHDVPFRLKAEPLQRGPAARTNEMGRMYLSVEQDRRAEAEKLLREETDLFAPAEEVGAAYLDTSDAGAEPMLVGTFEEAADLKVAEQALRDAGLGFTSTKETVEADEAEGIPATVVTNVEVKFEDYERAVEVLDKAFAELEA